MEHAYNRVKNIKGKPFEADYKSLAKTFPAMVQNNGLSVAIAFLSAKDKAHHGEKGHHGELNKAVLDWLKSSDCLVVTLDEGKDLMGNIVDFSREEYRLVSKETMLYAQWIKRFAEGMLESGE